MVEPEQDFYKDVGPMPLSNISRYQLSQFPGYTGEPVILTPDEKTELENIQRKVKIQTDIKMAIDGLVASNTELEDDDVINSLSESGLLGENIENLQIANEQLILARHEALLRNIRPFEDTTTEGIIKDFFNGLNK